MSNNQLRSREQLKTAPPPSAGQPGPTDADLHPDQVLVFTGEPKVVAARVSKALATLADAGFFVAVRRGAGDSVLVLVRLDARVADGLGDPRRIALSLVPWAKLEGVTDSFSMHSETVAQQERAHKDEPLWLARFARVHGAKAGAVFRLYRLALNTALTPLILGLGDRLRGAELTPVSLAVTLLNGVWTAAQLRSLYPSEPETAATESAPAGLVPEPQRAQFRGTPGTAREFRRALFIPLGIVLLALYTAGQLAVLALEIFLTQMYQGPMLGVAKLVPIAAGIAASIVFHIINDWVVERYTAWEDYPTDSELRAAKTQRGFYLDALLAYLPILLTAYLYLPFGNRLVGVFPAIQASRLGQRVPLVAYYQLDTQRLVNQTSFYLLQQPIINTVLGLIVPRVAVFVKKNVLKQITAANDSPFAREQLRVPFDADLEFKTLVLAMGYVLLLAPVWAVGSAAIAVVLVVRYKLLERDFARSLRKPRPDLSARATARVLDQWCGNLKFVVVAAAAVAPTIAVMYGSTNPARVFASEKLSYYYDYHTSAMQVSWAVIFAVALFGENVALASYTVMTRLLRVVSPPALTPLATQDPTRAKSAAAVSEEDEVWKNIDITKDLNAVFQSKLQ